MTIQPYNDIFRDQLLSVWEKSVRATHDFLKREDIDYYKTIVETINFNLFQVHCMMTDEGKLMGFMGVADNKVEMLFLDPQYIGQGIGTRLMDFAVKELKVTEVDVNEGNANAIKFYNKIGFTPYDRTPVDSEGKDYPIIKMKLSTGANI